MTAKFFVDTNILVYAHVIHEPDKMMAARSYLEDGLRYGIGVISTQVLNEFISVMTSKRPDRMTMSEVKVEVELLSGMELVEVDMPQIRHAIDMAERYQVNYWDALIIASAEKSGCRTILTEDFTPGQKFGRIQIVNPFRKQ